MIVQKGEITLLGATLTASKKSYMVYSPASHSLPVIRCSATDVNHAEICFQSYKSGLETLQGLSPLFGKLWNEDCGPLGPDFEYLLRKQKPGTYQMVRPNSHFRHHNSNTSRQLFPSQDNPPKSYLQPLISPPEWNATLSRIATSESPKNQITMICGPKASGKSTFARLLTNKLLSSNYNAKSQGIALLDLDPGQPEYSIPGSLSLTHIRDPNFGPPYTHPRPSDRGQTLRTHAISAITPSMDPTLYMACASDLYTHYRKLLSNFPKCPLIINTPGWVLGTGLEILVELITKVRPTEVLYMSEEGPREVVESLKEAAKSTPLYTLPSQSSEFTTRTAAHLRTMQYMSYFHLNPTTEGKLSWNNTPLTSFRPWEIKYQGEGAGILGVMCYGEQPPPSLLAETINGSLLSLVVIEDTSAIPGWELKDETKKEVTTKTPPKTKPQTQDFISLTTTTPPKTTKKPTTIPHRLLPTLQRLTITQTPENIPYFHPSPPPLPPQSSQSLGLLLVRGIDVPRKRLQVLTSIPSAQLEALNDAGKKVILVSGKLDTPGWAYTEELNSREGALKSKSKEDSSDEEEQGSGDGKADVETHDAFESVPWVEKLEGSQGRGVGARVWRVRRDLGKSGDGD